MAGEVNFYPYRSYEDLAKEFDTLARITDEKLRDGYQLSVGKNGFLCFAKPWRIQKAGAWARSATIGYSERDKKVINYLEKWFDDLLTSDVVINKNIKKQDWGDNEVKSFEVAFKGLATLATFYITSFSHRVNERPYYARKMETAKKIVKLARRYNLEWLKEKVQKQFDSDLVQNTNKKLNELVRVNFPDPDLVSEPQQEVEQEVEQVEILQRTKQTIFLIISEKIKNLDKTSEGSVQMKEILVKYISNNFKTLEELNTLLEKLKSDEFEKLTEILKIGEFIKQAAK